MGDQRRQRGEGSVDQLPSGRWRVRLPSSLKAARSLKRTFETEDDAERARLAALLTIKEGLVPLVPSSTLADTAAKYLAERAQRKPRSVLVRERLWRCHIATDEIATLPNDCLSRQDVAGFITRLQHKTIVLHGRKKRISPQYVHDVFALLDSICSYAVREGAMLRSPCEDQALPDIPRENASDHDDRWLDQDEQASLLECDEVSSFDRLTMGFAIGSGLREMEQMLLPRLTLMKAAKTGRLDVLVGGVNTDGTLRPPKNGTRTVLLVEWAVHEARRCLELLPEYCPRNPLGLAFPKPDGTIRKNGAPLNRHGRRGDYWQDAKRAAGIEKHITWHSLRRTCASSLFSGFWGRTWSIQEVAGYIGDTEKVTAEYYARVHSSVMEDAARATQGSPFRSRVGSRNGPSPRADHREIMHGMDPSRVRDTPACTDPSTGHLQGVTTGRDLLRDLTEVARAVQEEVAAGRFSDHDCDAFTRTVGAALPALIPLVDAHARASTRGPHRVTRVLELARLIRQLSKELAARKGRAS